MERGQEVGHSLAKHALDAPEWRDGKLRRSYNTDQRSGLYAAGHEEASVLRPDVLQEGTSPKNVQKNLKSQRTAWTGNEQHFDRKSFDDHQLEFKTMEQSAF